MLTKISKWSRIQDSFRITLKIESLVVFAIPDIPWKFQKDPSITFWVILLTHRQTDRQTLANITSLAEVKMTTTATNQVVARWYRPTVPIDICVPSRRPRRWPVGPGYQGLPSLLLRSPAIRSSTWGWSDLDMRHKQYTGLQGGTFPPRSPYMCITNNMQCSLHRVSEKKQSELFFPQLFKCLLNLITFGTKWPKRWNHAKCTHFPPQLIYVNALPCET